MTAYFTFFALFLFQFHFLTINGSMVQDIIKRIHLSITNKMSWDIRLFHAQSLAIFVLATNFWWALKDFCQIGPIGIQIHFLHRILEVRNKNGLNHEKSARCWQPPQCFPWYLDTRGRWQWPHRNHPAHSGEQAMAGSPAASSFNNTLPLCINMINDGSIISSVMTSARIKRSNPTPTEHNTNEQLSTPKRVFKSYPIFPVLIMIMAAFLMMILRTWEKRKSMSWEGWWQRTRNREDDKNNTMGDDKMDKCYD